MIPIYFESIDTSIEVTLRFFDRLLHADELVNRGGVWCSK